MELGLAYADALPPKLRRALAEAADVLIDTTIEDFSSIGKSDWSIDNWLVGSMLPPRYRLRYDILFAKKFFVCLVTVIWKLGQSQPMALSCVAEELAANILIEEATGILEEAGIDGNFGDFEDALFEDADFEYLYDDAYDGVENADAANEMGIGYLAFGDWFKQFGSSEDSSYTAVHPYIHDEQDSHGASSSDANVDANPDDTQ